MPPARRASIDSTMNAKNCWDWSARFQVTLAPRTDHATKGRCRAINTAAWSWSVLFHAYSALTVTARAKNAAADPYQRIRVLSIEPTARNAMILDATSGPQPIQNSGCASPGIGTGGCPRAKRTNRVPHARLAVRAVAQCRRLSAADWNSNSASVATSRSSREAQARSSTFPGVASKHCVKACLNASSCPCRRAS